MSSRTLKLDDRLYRYLLATGLRDDDRLQRLREETAALPQAGMQISPEQGQFMTMLARLMGVRRAIEIGTFTGYSALSVARALPPDGLLVACDVSAEWTSIGRRYWEEEGLSDRIQLCIGPALETLDRLLASGSADSFDLAFVDADKERYADYYERCLRLVRPGGAILIDNVLWGGAVADPARTTASTEAIRALNAAIHDDPRVDACLLPIGDGLTIARRR